LSGGRLYRRERALYRLPERKETSPRIFWWGQREEEASFIDCSGRRRKPNDFLSHKSGEEEEISPLMRKRGGTTGPILS